MMWLKWRRSKGFTLVEVMIVVVIIGILASLIIPRIVVQTRKALAVEAIQMVGRIRRALYEKHDLTGTYGPATAIASDGGGCYSGLTQGSWAEIEVKGPEFSNKWSYWLNRGSSDDFYIEACNNETGWGMVIYSNGPPTCSGAFEVNSDGTFCEAV